MATDQKDEGAGFVIWAVLIVGAGIWWWNRDSSAEPAPPAFVAASPNPTPTVTPMATPIPAPSPTAPPAPSHNYSFVEGDVYGYIAAVSEDERKAGKRAGDVITYRYAGYWDGEYHLEHLNDDGTVFSVTSCAKPCVALKTFYSGGVKRIAYDPGSVVGSAMEDAMNGQLHRKRAAKRAPAPLTPEPEPAEPVQDATAPTT